MILRSIGRRITFSLACTFLFLVSCPAFAQSFKALTADKAPSAEHAADPAAATAATPDPDPAAQAQPAAPAPAQDAVVLANGRVRIGATFYTDWAFYHKTGFGPQFVTQTNFPGPGNDSFNSFDVHRTYINLFFSPTDRVTLRFTPNIFREAIGGSADKLGATGAIPASADGNLTFRIKYAYLEFGKVFDASDAFKNTNIRFGSQMNPLIDWEEALWDYRWLSLVPWNYLSLSSTQVGVALNGPIGKNGKTYLDYQIGVFNDTNFHAFEQSEQKQFMVRGSVYPMGTRTRFQGLGITGFYDHAYTNNAPDTSAAAPVVREALLVHFTTPGNNAMIGGEYDWGKNAFSLNNMFSGSGPQDAFGLTPATAYATQTNLWRAALAGTTTKQEGWMVWGRANIPGSKFAVFGMDEFFQPNTNVPSDPLDFYHVVAGVAYRVSPRWRVAVSSQHIIYRYSQFTYSAALLAGFNPALAAANPAGIPNAVPDDTHATFLNFEFTF